MRQYILLALLCVLFTVSLAHKACHKNFADSHHGKDYFAVKSVQTTRVRNDTLTQEVLARFRQDKQQLLVQKAKLGEGEGGEIDPTVIINYALKIWEFIKANAPVVDYKKFYGNALPKGASSFFDLHSWNPEPSSHTYRTVYTNNFGMNVIDFTYSVVFMYNGTYGDDDTGRYLDHITIYPTNLNVAWGYTFNAGIYCLIYQRIFIYLSIITIRCYCTDCCEFWNC
jgi:hypothetical protein